MNRTDLAAAATRLHPLDLPTIGQVWIRTPTALDAIEADGKALGWYVCRFMAREDGSPWFAEQEQDSALRLPAWVATAVVGKVGELMQPPQDAGEAGAPASRLAAGIEHRGSGTNASA